MLYHLYQVCDRREIAIKAERLVWLIWHSVRPRSNRHNSGTAGSIEMSEAALEREKVPLRKWCRTLRHV